MPDTDALYRELKGDLQTVAEPLFELACGQVDKLGAFQPFGSKLSPEGEVSLVAAAPDEDSTTSDVVYPLMIVALQESARSSTAIALAEWVKITPDGGKQTDAVKVHTQHQRGLSVAFYIPATKKLFRSWQFGEMMVIPTDPLLETWPG